jgi:hypothetical protein
VMHVLDDAALLEAGLTQQVAGVEHRAGG